MQQTDELLHRVPPQDLKAEQAVLGAILLDNEALGRVSGHLRDGDFYRGAHQDIFRAMLELNSAREPIDLVTLPDRLRKAGKLEDIGGEPYLATLVDAMPTATGILDHARIVEVFMKVINILNDPLANFGRNLHSHHSR